MDKATQININMFSPHNHDGHPGSGELPKDLLPVTCSFLLSAVTKLLPRRGCSAVAFAFKGTAINRTVELVSIADRKGKIIKGISKLIETRPDGTVTLGSLLETAADLYLGKWLSPWDADQSARGMLLLVIGSDIDGSLKVIPRCVADFRSSGRPKP